MGTATRDLDDRVGRYHPYRAEREVARGVSTAIADVRTEASSRLLLVSNRLPYSVIGGGDDVELRRSSGGLVTALERVHERADSLWIGYLGPEPLHARPEIGDELQRGRMAAVALSELEVTGFYRRYANGILWPALHGMTPPAPRDRCGWGMYRAANERFADVVAQHWRPGDRIWVHDYQLLLLPSLLRARLPDCRIGFFLHTPLPAPEELARLPEWDELARGLLGADVIGLQTRRDARHFLASTGGAPSADDAAAGTIVVDGRSVQVVACPIGIDGAWFEARTRHPAVAAKRAALRVDNPGPLFVGVDRLDYTKGIAERLLAFERLLLAEPELRGHARFLQVAVPSRDGVGGYAETRQRVEAIVARINRRFGSAEWQPVLWVHGSVDPDTLVALYAAADVMVVTPKRDGMNLVAKEFVAARGDGGGVLVLSRNAGAAAELDAAVLINPDDVDSIVDGYRRALAMSPGEARPRMRALRAAVASGNVHGWAARFLRALAGTASVEGDMATQATTAAACIDRDDLGIVASLAGMRFQLRAPEAQRAGRVRDVTAAAAELSKALARYVQSAGLVAESARLEHVLAPETAAMFETLCRFAAAVRATANDFRTVVHEPPAIADVSASMA